MVITGFLGQQRVMTTSVSTYNPHPIQNQAAGGHREQMGDWHGEFRKF
jgi:hypothetical protein